MGAIATPFEPLQAAVARANRERGFDPGHPWHSWLKLGESEGLIDVEYRGEYELWFNDRTTINILDDLLGLLASREIAPHLRSFAYSTDAAIAANGTYTILIDPLVATEQIFPKLSRFVLDQGEGEHGYKILASALNGGDGFYEEAGVLAQLLNRASALHELVTPSPPSRDFFCGQPHPLRSLDVDAGFGHVGFIQQLARCSRFPELRRLVFTDFRQQYLDDWRDQTTSFGDYVSFFDSEVSSKLESICLRDVNLTHDQVHSLLNLRSEGVEIIRNKAATET